MKLSRDEALVFMRFAFMFGGVMILFISAGRDIKIDLSLFCGTVYGYLATMFVEKKLFLPKMLQKVYSFWHENLSLFTYLPLALVLFDVGYRYGRHISDVGFLFNIVFSISLGLFVSIIIYFLNTLVFRKLWGGE